MSSKTIWPRYNIKIHKVNTYGLSWILWTEFLVKTLQEEVS